MIKKKLFRQIFITTAILFALTLMYLIPKDENNYLEKVDDYLIYVDSIVNTNEIYLIDKSGYLAKTKVVIDSNNINNKIKELIDILVIGGVGENKIPSGFKSLIPSETKVMSLELNNKLLKINFNEELLNTDIKLEEKIIESIIYTLTSLDEIDNIIIYVNNDILTTLPQTKKILPSLLNRSFGINKKYDLSSINDISSITTYYISTYNDNTYYVPVTSYINSNDNKIRLIIDNLTSSNLYNTNLMSYLNSNAKLLEVNESIDSLNLTFNNYIFDNIEEKKILEEVIYTISLSIKDNYNVKEVIFNVNNEEIYKSTLKSIE